MTDGTDRRAVALRRPPRRGDRVRVGHRRGTSSRQLTELGAEVIGLDMRPPAVRAQRLSPKSTSPIRRRSTRAVAVDRRPGRRAVQRRRGVVGHRRSAAGRHDQLPRHAAPDRGVGPADAGRVGDRQRVVARRLRTTGSNAERAAGLLEHRDHAPRASTGVDEHPDALADGGYRLSKEAIILYGMTNVVALGAKGIRINCTGPGVTETPILDQLRTAYGQGFLDDIPKPLGPGLRPDEQAACWCS